MASTSNYWDTLRTEGERVDMAEDSPMLQRLLNELANIQRANASLQEEMATLTGQASSAHKDLERRLGEHLEQRLSLTNLESTGRTHIKPVRPQRFKGNGEGPRIHDWLHQAEQYVGPQESRIRRKECGTSHPSSREMPQFGGDSTLHKQRTTKGN